MSADFRITSKPCPICGDVKVFYVPLEGYIKRINGGLIQDCFPELSADDRERLITGWCPSHWDDLFGGSDDE